jgi:hypothetical protein
VDFDAIEFRRSVGRFARNQVPFAIAQALTWTVQDTRDRLVKDLPRTFTIRSKWTERGLRISPAKKTDLRAVVGSRDEYMAEQAVGAVKEGKGASVPVRARPRKTSRTTRGKWPGAMLAKGAFKRKGARGATLVFKPLKGRKRKRGRARGRLKLMWVLARRVRVTARWDLEGTLRATAKRRWVRNMAYSWKRALATKR